MGADRETTERIARDLLRLYTQALAARQLAVAEHLMCALETLARSDVAGAAMRDQAYLALDQRPGPAERCTAGRRRG